MGSAPAKSGDGAKGRRHGASASFLGKLILAFLGLLGGISGGFRRLSDYLKARRIERLLLRSDRSIRLLEKEAGAFGIDLHGSGAVDYYSILGIRPGSGQEEIKEAYHELVKKHHPDVSKELDAGQITQKINEAYSALKDGEQRRQYDRSFASGAQAIGAADARRISNELLRRYMKARAEDFARFAEATSGPIQLDDLTAAIDDVCAWKKRFGKVDSAMFKKFTRYGKSVRRLSEANRKLLGRGPEEKAAARLRENSLRLDELSKAYEGVDRSLSAIRKNLRDEVVAQETEVARKLRASVKYA
jgi:curved DNA-binding protein CbpA